MQLPNRNVEVPDLQPINHANIRVFGNITERRYGLPESFTALAHHVVTAEGKGFQSHRILRRLRQ